MRASYLLNPFNRLPRSNGRLSGRPSSTICGLGTSSSVTPPRRARSSSPRSLAAYPQLRIPAPSSTPEIIDSLESQLCITRTQSASSPRPPVQQWPGLP